MKRITVEVQDVHQAALGHEPLGCNNTYRMHAAAAMPRLFQRTRSSGFLWK
jgi:hypothetical protein